MNGGTEGPRIGSFRGDPASGAVQRRSFGVRFRWVAGLLTALLFFGSSSPSPLYGVYQARWHFDDAVLTEVFAVYAVTVVVALLLLGPLSDRYGRRLLAGAGLAVVESSMLVFKLASDVGWLFAARALQGAGVGIAGVALAASIVDSNSDDPTAGALQASIWANIGLGGGVLTVGLLVMYTSAATSIVFDAMLAVFGVAIALSATLPKRTAEVPMERGSSRTALASINGQRGVFVVHGVGLAVSWALAGLYLSLGPAIAAVLTPPSSRWSETLPVASLGLVGALAAWLGRRLVCVRQVYFGSPVVVVGLLLVICASAARSDATFVVGSMVLAAGWGLLAVGSFRALVGLSHAQNRAGVISLAYLISYGAFSIPAVAAGVAAGSYGVRWTMIVFGAVAGFAVAAAWGFSLWAAHVRGFAPSSDLSDDL